MAAGNEMRVSDAEREAAAAELQEHFASGRLDQDELNERLAAALAAKTRGDLTALFTDLPSAGHGPASTSAPGGPEFGPGGPFQTSGPFGAGGSEFGTGGPFGANAADAGSEWRAGDSGRGSAGRGSAGRSIGRLVAIPVMMWILWTVFAVGIVGIFGIGAGRPIWIVLIFAALALLRRLVFRIFGWRLGGRGRGRGGRGRGPRRRR